MAGSYYNGYRKSLPRTAAPVKWRATYTYRGVGRQVAKTQDLATDQELDALQDSLDQANQEADRDGGQGGRDYKLVKLERWVRGRGWVDQPVG
jgi:hypothetical protein